MRRRGKEPLLCHVLLADDDTNAVGVGGALWDSPVPVQLGSRGHGSRWDAETALVGPVGGGQLPNPNPVASRSTGFALASPAKVVAAPPPTAAASGSVTAPPPALSAGTYFTHEAKGADDAADADTAIINAEGGQNNSEEKKEYFI